MTQLCTPNTLPNDDTQDPEGATMQKNVFAYTHNIPTYPEFLSINRQDDGRLTITVRGPLIKDGIANDKGETFDTSGVTADMTLPHNQLGHLIDALKAYYAVYGEPAAA